MSFCCVCYDAGPNKSFEIQKEDPKYLTTLDILKKVNPENDNEGNEAGISSFLWYRSTRCAINLKDKEYPLTNYPSLILSTRPELYETLPESLQIFTSLASTEIQNGHPGYSIFYLNVKHTTGHNIPRIYLPVMTKKMYRSSLELYDIINESFATLGSVETKAVLNANGEAYTKLSSVQAVFDELQQLDQNQRDCANDKKKKNNLDEVSKKNVTVEIEFSESALQKLNQRSSLSEDILNTEKQYLECLKTLDTFWNPKLKEESLLTDEEHDYIFKDIKTIISSHQAFCQALEQAENGYASEFGRLFLSYAPFFKISSEFIAKYPLINKMIEKKANESTEFSERITALAKEAPQTKQSLDNLSSYLIQPVKRFPYYNNFLKSIIKVTPNNHPDALFLPLAKKEIADFITQVEEKSDSTTKSAIMMNIQVSNSDGFDYVTPQRKLTQSFPISYIKNQSLTTNANKQNNESQENQGYFHVCNDYVFLVNKQTSKCIYKSPLLQFHYFNSPNENTITVSTIKDGNNTDDCVTKSYDVQFQNEEDENNFFSLIEPQAEQKAEGVALPNHSFLWKAKKLNTELKPVSDHASVFNGNEHVFFGGCGPSDKGNPDYYSNFVLYNNDDVNEIESGIKGRKFHTFTNVNDKLFVIGGETASNQNNGKIFVYDGEHKGWVAVDCSQISQRSGHTAAPHGKDEIIIYGGIPSDDGIYSLNTTTYELKQLPIEGSQDKDQNKIPTNRYKHTAIVHNDKMIVYGGRSTETDEILSDLWSFDLTQNKWNLIKWDLLQRFSHHALVIGDEMVIIGGEGSNQSFTVNLNDFNVKFIDEFGNLPTNLIGSSVSYDPTNKNIIVYGGCESAGGPPTSALYELKMNQDWQDSINNDQEVVERDIVTDLSPNFIEIDEDGNVNEVPSPEEAENAEGENANEEEEVELEVDVEFEEDGTEEIDEDVNLDQIQDEIQDFNDYDEKIDDIEGGDNQNANDYNNDMNFDDIINDIKNDEKKDQERDQEYLDSNDLDQKDIENGENPEEKDKDQQIEPIEEDDNEKLLTEPLEEEDLFLTEPDEEEENGQQNQEKNPWELASDDIQDGLSDDHSNVNEFEPDKDNKNNEEETKNESNQFEPDEDNTNNEEETENEGNQFEPDEDDKNNEEETENESNLFEPDEDENEENKTNEEDEDEGNKFEPSGDENEEEEDEFNSDEINDYIEGVDELEKELEESKKLQDQHKNNQNEENEGTSDLDTDKLSEDLGKSDELSNEQLSTNSEEEEEEANENNQEEEENGIESGPLKIEESNDFEISDKNDEDNNDSNIEDEDENEDQKLSSSHGHSHSHHHYSSASGSSSRGHHHHHSSSHGGHSHSHSHSRHHSSRRDESSDYMHDHSSSSSHRGDESDHGRNKYGNNNNNNNRYNNDDNDFFKSSENESNSLSSYSNMSSGQSNGGNRTPSFAVKKPKISKEKKKELERRKNMMMEDSSSDMSSSFSPTAHRKPNRKGGNTFGQMSDDDESNSDEGGFVAPSKRFQDNKTKEKYRFTTFSLQKTNCSYLPNNNQNQNNSPYGGGYQSPGFSPRQSPRNTRGSGNRFNGGGGGSGSGRGFGDDNASSSYFSPTVRSKKYSNSSSFSSYNNNNSFSSSSSAVAGPSVFTTTSPRRRNFDFESSGGFDGGSDDDNFGQSYNSGFASPTRNRYGGGGFSTGSSGRGGQNKQFFFPSDFINTSPFSKKNRSNDPLYKDSTSYGPRRHHDD